MLARLLGAVVVPLVVATALASPAHAQEPNGCATPIAHRGVAQGTVENTLKAFRQAAAVGVGFETDLRTTSDGYLVLMHNANVRATTDGSGKVATMTLHQVRQLRTDDGQQVPTLRQALRLVRDTPGTHVTLDLKSLTDASFERVVSLVRTFGIQSRVRSIAFSERAPRLVQLRAELPGVQVARIWTSTEAAPTPEEVAPYGGAQLSYEHMSADWVGQMDAAGYVVSMSNTDDAAAWQAAEDWGIDRVLTDTVAEYQAWCGS